LNDPGFIQRLRLLIGRNCLYLGRHCQLVEILAEEGTLVLEVREAIPPIQPNLYGQATYRANEVMHVQIFAEDRESLSDDLLELLVHLDTE